MRPSALRLALVRLALRLTIKRRLARARDADRQRALFEHDARNFRVPRDARFSDETIRRPDGSGIAALWAECGEPAGNRAILFLHGGAFFMGSPNTHRHLAAALAGRARARALVPDYRLMPEHPFPAALEDSLAAYHHLLDAGHGPDSIALAGDSAGGGLCFSLLLKLAEAGLPAPAAVVAIGPWVDLTGFSASLRRNARRDPMLPAWRIADTIALYLQGQDPADPLASPVRGRFREPPPALIFAGREEILSDDARQMAETLRRDGGEAILELWPGVAHDWPMAWGWIAEADRAVTMAGDFLDARLHG